MGRVEIRPGRTRVLELTFFSWSIEMASFIDLSGNTSTEDDDSYTLIGKVSTEPPSLLGKLATSSPVKAIDSFNKSFIDLMVSSLGFVAALSWNDWIKSLFLQGGVFYKSIGANGLLYVALFVTILAYVATAFVTSIFPDREIAKKNNPITIEK
jgi:hypothetical protein